MAAIAFDTHSPPLCESPVFSENSFSSYVPPQDAGRAALGTHHADSGAHGTGASLTLCRRGWGYEGRSDRASFPWMAPSCTWLTSSNTLLITGAGIRNIFLKRNTNTFALSQASTGRRPPRPSDSMSPYRRPCDRPASAGRPPRAGTVARAADSSQTPSCCPAQ